jgi:hypothetical protein
MGSRAADEPALQVWARAGPDQGAESGKPSNAPSARPDMVRISWTRALVDDHARRSVPRCYVTAANAASNDAGRREP